MALNPRRWLRFSLRTMFVAFTVVAVWLGWNVWLVRERQEFLKVSERSAPPRINPKLLAPEKFQEPHFDEARTVAGISHLMFRHRNVAFERYEPTAPRAVSFIRKALGDEPRWLLAFYPGSKITVERARTLFPEAIILVAVEPWPPW